VDHKFFKLLEKYHHEKWVWLGTPIAFWAPNGINLKFAWRNFELRLGDAELDADPRLNPYWKLFRIFSWIGLLIPIGLVLLAAAMLT
jgi:hypothetical protein